MNYLLPIIIIGFALALLWRATVGFALIIIMQLVLVQIGLFTLVQDGRASPGAAWIYLTAIVALSIGYFVTDYILRHSRHSRPAPQLKAIPDSVVWSMVIVAGLLALYHLVASGIPIFSSQIETARFDFTSSGLFGIPGRMYLFGVNISWIFAAVNAEARGVRWRKYGPWRLATIFLSVSAILSGFKGELLSLALTFMALYTIISGSRLTLGGVIRRYWWAGVIAIAYFAAIAALYPSYSSPEGSVFGRFFERLTVVPAIVAQYALDGFVYFPPGNPIASDFVYFTHKYVGGELPGTYSFERAVSASIIGANPASDAWTTPVTVGAFPELLLSVGPALAIVALLLVGIALSVGESSSRVSTSGLVLRAIAGLFFASWIVKGGFVYYLFNLSAVTLFLLLVGQVALLLSKPRTSNRGGVAGWSTSLAYPDTGRARPLRPRRSR